MSALLKPLGLDEFLQWERAQKLRYEFDGTQPVAMTGGSTQHARLITRLAVATATRLAPPCEAFASELKVIGANRVRYPDVTIACVPAQAPDEVCPRVVFEVSSPRTALTDRRVKLLDYADIASILVYVIIAQDAPEGSVFRRLSGWAEERLIGRDAVIHLPEAALSGPLSALYPERTV